jgi:hypothetical protein
MSNYADCQKHANETGKKLDISMTKGTASVPTAVVTTTTTTFIPGTTAIAKTSASDVAKSNNTTILGSYGAVIIVVMGKRLSFHSRPIPAFPRYFVCWDLLFCFRFPDFVSLTLQVSGSQVPTQLLRILLALMALSLMSPVLLLLQ